MSGFRATPNKSLSSVRRVNRPIGIARDSALRSPDFQGMFLWRSDDNDNLAIVDGDNCLSSSILNSNLDMGHVSVYFRHIGLLARNCVRGGCEARHFVLV